LISVAGTLHLPSRRNGASRGKSAEQRHAERAYYWRIPRQRRSSREFLSHRDAARDSHDEGAAHVSGPERDGKGPINLQALHGSEEFTMRRFLASVVAVTLVLALVGVADAKGKAGGKGHGRAHHSKSMSKSKHRKHLSKHYKHGKGKYYASKGKHRHYRGHRFSHRWYNGDFWSYYDDGLGEWLYYDDVEGGYVPYPTYLIAPPPVAECGC
jgi:Ni/Co efflux regulator RcnB